MTSNKFSPRDHFPISSITANLCHYTYLQNIQLHILAYTNEFLIFCLLVQTTWNISATGYFYWDQSIHIPNNAFLFRFFWSLIKKVCIICYQYVIIQTMLLLDSTHSLIRLCTFFSRLLYYLAYLSYWYFRVQQTTYWYCHYFLDCKICGSQSFGTEQDLWRISLSKTTNIGFSFSFLWCTSYMANSLNNTWWTL